MKALHMIGWVIIILVAVPVLYFGFADMHTLFFGPMDNCVIAYTKPGFLCGSKAYLRVFGILIAGVVAIFLGRLCIRHS